jgi:thioesterase domain-containing protein/acyl carrier protein
LAEVLPAYMVPAAVVALPELPRTPNGKVDRSLLPPAAAASPVREVVGARSDTETRLVRLWEEVLGVAPIGVTDDFFDLGVDSLTAARLFTRIEQEFGRRLPFAPVFAAPTIEALAATLQDTPASRRFSALVPIQPSGQGTAVFGVHGGAGTILLYSELARQIGRDRPFYGLQAVGLYGDEAPQTSIPAMARRYVREVRAVQPDGPYVLAGYCFGGLVAFEMGRQLETAGAQVHLVAMLNAPSPAYIRRYDPVFDEEGALTDASGALVDRVRPTIDTSLAARLRRRATSQPTLRSRVNALASSAGRAAARVCRYRVAEARFRMILALRRPLPDALRENAAFQRLAASAQKGYDPSPARFPVLVVHAAGLYHEADLGWGPYTSIAVHTVEVAGEQRVPRDTMRQPHVVQVANGMKRLLDDSSGTQAVAGEGGRRR